MLETSSCYVETVVPCGIPLSGCYIPFSSTPLPARFGVFLSCPLSLSHQQPCAPIVPICDACIPQIKEGSILDQLSMYAVTSRLLCFPAKISWLGLNRLQVCGSPLISPNHSSVSSTCGREQCHRLADDASVGVKTRKRQEWILHLVNRAGGANASRMRNSFCNGQYHFY